MSQQRPCFICLENGEYKLIQKEGRLWNNPDGSIHSHTKKCDYCPGLVRPDHNAERMVNDDDGEQHACEGYLRANGIRVPEGYLKTRGIKVNEEMTLDSFFSDSGASSVTMTQ